MKKSDICCPVCRGDFDYKIVVWAHPVKWADDECEKGLEADCPNCKRWFEIETKLEEKGEVSSNGS